MDQLANVAAPEPETPVEVIAAPQPWRAWLLPLPSLPMPQDRFQVYQEGLRTFAEEVGRSLPMREALGLQLWKLSGKHGGDLLQRHLDRWKADLGFGIWPNRPAPTGWNEDSIQDAAAAVYRGDEPALPMHRMLLFKMEDITTLRDALQQMGGFGAAVHMFTRATVDEIRQRGREEFLPRVADQRFRGGKVYLPVLDVESVRAAQSSAELDRWLCAVDIYVRESAEDRGLLVLSKLPSDAVPNALEKLGRTLA